MSLRTPCPGGATVTQWSGPSTMRWPERSFRFFWPTPHVDLFASEKNHKLPVFFSIRPSPSSSGVNVLTQNWECLYGYVYPPTALIPRVLRKLRLQPTAQILLVAPFWPSQQGSAFVDRGFWANVADTAARARRESTRRVYGSRLKHYQRWCVDRGVDPVKAPLMEVAEFLENLRTIRHKGNPLAPSTFAGYRSAIAAIHQGFSDGSTVSSNSDLSTLLKGIFVVAAMPRTLKETWDLPTVLRYLAGPPFEPLAMAPLKSVAIKTAFLIQLASARRVSWVHSCRIDPSHPRWENGGVRLLHSLLLDKNQSSSFTPGSVFLLSLKEHSPDDRVHCPLRALKWYLKLTEPLRGAEKALFLISKEPYKKASKGTVAGWVKEAISGAYSPSRGSRESRWAFVLTTPEGSQPLGRPPWVYRLKRSWILRPGVDLRPPCYEGTV